MTKITIVTPVYNGEKYIRETVESVLSQEGDFELEYIIRDGASTDGTLDILKEYQDRCIIVSEKDGSPQEAINAGLSMATGDISAWLNADDIYLPGTLQAVKDCFDKHKEIGWMYGRCRIIDETGTEIRKPVTWYKNLIGWSYSRNILLCENFVNQPATFWRTSLWNELGGLNSKYKAAWDYELWLKMAEKSPSIHIKKYLAEFRRHSESISENNFEKQFNEELAIASEHGNSLHRFIHAFNCWKIITAYKMLS